MPSNEPHAADLAVGMDAPDSAEGTPSIGRRREDYVDFGTRLLNETRTRLHLYNRTSGNPNPSKLSCTEIDVVVDLLLQQLADGELALP